MSAVKRARLAGRWPRGVDIIGTATLVLTAMDRPEVDRIPGGVERGLAKGEQIDLMQLGFWRAVEGVKRHRVDEAYADRVSAIQRVAFRRSPWIDVSHDVRCRSTLRRPLVASFVLSMQDSSRQPRPNLRATAPSTKGQNGEVRPKRVDVVVVGAGPNGLAAAITLARAGRSVRVLEAASSVGGGTRSASLTLPGFVHDVCSAIHPLAAGSPFFRSLSLAAHELELVHAPHPLAHTLDNGTAVLLKRSVEATAADLGQDAGPYRALMAPLVRDWPTLAEPVLAPPRVPRRPLALARFAVVALRSAAGLARARFTEPRARALLAGLAAHSMLPLDRIPSAAFGLVLGLLGHVYGWPVARGGSQRIADALVSRLQALGGTVVTGHVVNSVDELAAAPLALLDVTPRQLLRMAGAGLPRSYQRRLARYRYGPGVYKMDWALDGPIPWRAPECARAATVHVGGTLEEIVDAEAAVGRGEHPERPFVLLAQPSLFDETRAPAGKHTAWAYCHVPLDSRVEMAERIERQIERFAPGFRDRILARHAMAPKELEHYNPNYVGGDINGGSTDLRQLFTRPVIRLVPYATPIRGLYLCSASTPPGGGVHGMCGYWAAEAALRAT